MNVKKTEFNRTNKKLKRMFTWCYICLYANVNAETYKIAKKSDDEMVLL